MSPSLLRVVLALLTPLLGGCGPGALAAAAAVAVSLSGGGGGDGAGAPHLTVEPGANSPAAQVAFRGEAGVVLLQVRLTSGKADVLVSEIRFHASGSGDDAADIPAARLHRDLNGDGVLDPGEASFGSPATYLADDGDLILVGLDEPIPSGTQVDWLLVYDMGPSPAGGDVFCASLPSETDVGATVGGRRARVDLVPGIQGCLTMIEGTIGIAAGPAMPPARSVDQCAAGEGALQLRLSVGPVEDVRVDSLTFSAFGTGNDAADLSAAWLYFDVDGDGQLDPTDTWLGGPAGYPSDDGRVTFSGISRVLPASVSELWLLAYDLSGSAAGGESFTAVVATNADLTATGVTSSQQVTVTGASVAGNPISALEPLLLSAAFLDGNDNGLLDAADRITVDFGQDVTIQGSPPADTVFLLDPPGSFGSGAVVAAGPAPSTVEIALRPGATLQPNGSYGIDAGASGLNLAGGQTALTDCAGSALGPAPVPLDLSGELRPRVLAASLTDVNENCVLDPGDTLEVTFTTAVDLTTADPNLAFLLPVTGDDLGIGARFQGGGMPTGANPVIVVLGSSPTIRASGTFDPADLVAGSPSGIDAVGTGEIVDSAYPSVLAAPGAPPGVDLVLTPVTPIWTAATQGSPPSGFGGSIASAGDVNGDGYLDVIVGDSEIHTPRLNAGSAYVFHGGPGGLSTIPDWTSAGDDQSGARFGFSVSSAGDVNNDGFSDVVIATPLYDTTNRDAGKAYLYLGGSGGLAASPAWTSSGDDRISDNFGQSAAPAGDVNDDGFSDVIVSAPYADTPTVDAGRAYLFLGETGGLGATPAWTSSGDDQRNAWFGLNAVASAGDVNNDGYSDVIVGAFQFDAPASNAGKAYVFMGGPGGLAANPDWTSTGDGQAGANFGLAVASAGDVNGDGYSDVIVGARMFDTLEVDAGKAYLYYGSNLGLAASPAWTSSGDDQGGAHYGLRVASGGDVNGDGYSDVLVGAPRFDAGATNTGKAYLYFGGPGGLSIIADWTSSGDGQVDGGFGVTVATAYDVNNDGLDDVFIGAPGVLNGPGKVFIFSVCLP